MDWTNGFFDPLDLLLDTDNPRIDISSDETQDEIRKKSLQTERVLDLAQDIVEANGLLMGERIIVAQENRRHIVLEGIDASALVSFFWNRN